MKKTTILTILLLLIFITVPVKAVDKNGDTIYYSNPYDGDKLYKLDVKTEEKVKLSDDHVGYVNYYQGWLYYTNYSDEGRLYRIKPDGKDKTILNEKSLYPRQTKIVNDIIYFNKEGYIWRINLDGTDLQQYDQREARLINIMGGWVYYAKKVKHQQYNGVEQVYRIRMDGTGEELIIEEPVFDIFVSDGWLYYRNDQFKLYKMRADQRERVLIKENTYFYIIGVIGDWIYYRDEGAFGVIGKLRTDGNEDVRITEPYSGDYIWCEEGWVFYFGEADLRGFSRISLDGEDEERIYNIQYQNQLDFSYDYPAQLTIHEDWLYYKTENGSIYRVKTDGSRIEELGQENISGFKLNQKFLYYYKYDDEIDQYQVYRSNLDGTDSQEVLTCSSFGGVGDNWIVYQGQHSIYQANLDGSAPVKLIDDYDNHIKVVDKCLYYWREEGKSRGSFRIDLNTGQHVKLSDDIHYRIVGDGFYYEVTDDNRIEIWKEDIETHEKVKIHELEHTYYGFEMEKVTGDWIYVTYNTGELYYNYSAIARIKTDGTEFEDIKHGVISDIVVTEEGIYSSSISFAKHLIGVSSNNFIKILD